MTTTIAYMCAQRYETLSEQKIVDETIYIPFENLQICKSGFAGKVPHPLTSFKGYKVFAECLKKELEDTGELNSKVLMEDYKAKVAFPISVEFVEKIKILVEQRDLMTEHKRSIINFNRRYEQLNMPDRYPTAELEKNIRNFGIEIQKTIETSGLFN